MRSLCVEQACGLVLCVVEAARARAAFLVPPKRVRVDLFMDGGMRH